MRFGERRGVSRGRVSPILFVVDVAHDSTVIEDESALDEDLGDPAGLGEGRCVAVPFREADHGRVAAQEEVHTGRVQGQIEVLFQHTRLDEILDVDLVVLVLGFAGGQREVAVIREPALQLPVLVEIGKVLPETSCANRDDAAPVAGASPASL